jgi:hypothetical protein
VLRGSVPRKGFWNIKKSSLPGLIQKHGKLPLAVLYRKMGRKSRAVCEFYVNIQVFGSPGEEIMILNGRIPQLCMI